MTWLSAAAVDSEMDVGSDELPVVVVVVVLAEADVVVEELVELCERGVETVEEGLLAVEDVLLLIIGPTKKGAAAAESPLFAAAAAAASCFDEEEELEMFDPMEIGDGVKLCAVDDSDEAEEGIDNLFGIAPGGVHEGASARRFCSALLLLF